jgi:uncharacterized repeat protein (TIGR03803 family)
MLALLVLAALAQAQTFTSIFSFDGTDGSYPYTGRPAYNGGTLYGATSDGGTSGYGVVFSVTTAGTETVLYNFTGSTDGGYPYGPVIRDSKGNLYGTTYYGGSGYGVVFKLTPKGKETALYSFTGSTDGAYPYQGLVMDKKGNLYGTTYYGGANSLGVIYKVTKKGKETVLHNFAGGSSDGDYPFYGSMLMDTKGNLYGLTEEGGSSNCYGYGCGALYELTAKGTFKVLYGFAGGTTDGCYPFGTPAMDSKGNFYGTTDSCGANGYYGTVWKVSKKGTETILYNGNYSSTDCAYMGGGVTLDKQDNLYGLAEIGGANYDGCLYEVSPTGTLTILHSFDYSDGGDPWGDEVTLVGKGDTLYGLTSYGGSDYEGTVWSYVP